MKTKARAALAAVLEKINKGAPRRLHVTHDGTFAFGGGAVERLTLGNGLRVLVLVDHDESETRRGDVLRDVPDDLAERVYLLGVWSEPESLQNALNHRPRERIGAELARECLDDTGALWQHALLAHNADEIARLRAHVLPFLR
jgi:hypothetical protein